MKTLDEVTISYRTIRRILFVGVVVLLIFLLKSLILVFLTALVIATFITATSMRLERKGINRRLAVVGLYVIGIAVLFALFYIM